MTIRTERSRRSVTTVALLVFGIVLFARAIYVSLYALPVPYWDQWDAEGAFLLIPWEDSGLTWSQMFAPHNEHRIFWSRVLSLLVYEGSGKVWDNQTLAYISSGILALVAAMIAALTWRSRAALPAKVSTVLVLLALGTLPFAWENIPAGFQNSFYFMMLWGTLGIILTVYAHGAAWRLLALFAAVACIFSMASGVIWVGAMVFIGVIRAWQEKHIPAGIIAYLLAVAGIMLWGLDLVPEVAHHAGMKSTGFVELLTAAAVGLSWPWQSASWAAIPLWIPAVTGGLLAIRRRLTSRTDQFMLALAVVAAGQALAIAHSRGKGMTDISSRYSELLMLGMVANTWLAFRMTFWFSSLEKWRRSLPLFTGLACVWLVFLCAGLYFRTPNDFANLHQRHELSCIQTYNVRLFLMDGQLEGLNRPAQHIPYPSPERLATLAGDPTLSQALQHLLEDEATEGCGPPPRREFLTQVDESLGSVPLVLQPGSVMKMRHESSLAASMDGVTILIGTYFGSSDGMMTVKACVDERCAAGEASLVEALDNQPLVVELKPTLRLAPGDQLELTFASQGATSAVAIWSYSPASSRAMTIVEGEGIGRTTKSTLLLRD
jgi:hypothetical protein